MVRRQRVGSEGLGADEQNRGRWRGIGHRCGRCETLLRPWRPRARGRHPGAADAGLRVPALRPSRRRTDRRATRRHRRRLGHARPRSRDPGYRTCRRCVERQLPRHAIDGRGHVAIAEPGRIGRHCGIDSRAWLGSANRNPFRTTRTHRRRRRHAVAGAAGSGISGVQHVQAGRDPVHQTARRTRVDEVRSAGEHGEPGARRDADSLRFRADNGQGGPRHVSRHRRSPRHRRGHRSRDRVPRLSGGPLDHRPGHSRRRRDSSPR